MLVIFVIIITSFGLAFFLIYFNTSWFFKSQKYFISPYNNYLKPTWKGFYIKTTYLKRNQICPCIYAFKLHF